MAVLLSILLYGLWFGLAVAGFSVNEWSRRTRAALMTVGIVGAMSTAWLQIQSNLESMELKAELQGVRSGIERVEAQTKVPPSVVVNVPVPAAPQPSVALVGKPPSAPTNLLIINAPSVAALTGTRVEARPDAPPSVHFVIANLGEGYTTALVTVIANSVNRTPKPVEMGLDPRMPSDLEIVLRSESGKTTYPDTEIRVELVYAVRFGDPQSQKMRCVFRGMLQSGSDRFQLVEVSTAPVTSQ